MKYWIVGIAIIDTSLWLVAYWWWIMFTLMD